MRSLDELIDDDDPALQLLRQWVADATVAAELLPPSAARRDEVLSAVQVTTRSTLGALAYDTGGLLVDGGWLRHLGSGHPRLPRDLASWNAGRADGFVLVADDAAGGFFAIDGGGLGGAPGQMVYFAPDSLRWEALEIGHTDFVGWSLSPQLAEFYTDLRWDDWGDDVAALSTDAAFAFYPPLWTAEGSPEDSTRAPIPVAELYDLHRAMAAQLDDTPS